MTGCHLLNSVQRKAYFDHLVTRPDDVDGLLSRKASTLGAAGVTHLYKYCSPQTAQKIMTQGLLLQPPDRYNDPFDCMSGAYVWSSEYRFAPDSRDIEGALSELRGFPTKYQLPNYDIHPDMRASYYFAATCFSERHDDHLLWSHYGDNHRGFCLAFEIDPLIAFVHPCNYFNSIPTSVSWRSGNPALALIKGDAWAYEMEWRAIKKTIRPKIRVLGSMTHQIYNSVHSNPEFSSVEHEEWNRLNSELMRRLENEYNRERTMNIRPSRIILGLNISHQFSNVLTGHVCDEVRVVAEREKIPVSRMCLKGSSFDLVALDVDHRNGWTQPLQ